MADSGMTGDKKMSFTVGQEVFHTSGYRAALRTQIIRVGVKYAYIKHYNREIAFDKVTGTSRTSTDGRIWTLEQYERHQQHETVREELSQLGFRMEGTGRLSTSALEGILAIVKADMAEETSAEKRGDAGAS